MGSCAKGRSHGYILNLYHSRTQTNTNAAVVIHARIRNFGSENTMKERGDPLSNSNGQPGMRNGRRVPGCGANQPRQQSAVSRKKRRGSSPRRRLPTCARSAPQPIQRRSPKRRRRDPVCHHMYCPYDSSDPVERLALGMFTGENRDCCL